MSKLTDHQIKNAKPQDKDYTLSDGRGLTLLVKSSGSKLWRLRYTINGKRAQISLGSYPDTSLARARLLREQHLTEVACGISPAEKRQQEKAEREAKQLTFKVVAERWYHGNTVVAAKPWAPATARKARIYLEKDLYPALGKMPIADVTRADLFKAVKRMEKRGAIDAAKKARQWLVSIFDDAINAGELKDNPAVGMKASHSARGAETRSNPNVGFAGLPTLLETVEASGAHVLVKLATRLLALIACRPGELRQAKWCEFDLTNAVWTIPAERMKMRKEQKVPLSRQALEILEQVRMIRPEGHLFVVQGNKPITDMTINMMLKRLGYKGKQTAHGFRHLLSTELHERGYNPDWIEVQLAHIIPGMRGVYNGAQYLEQRRGMMQDWADSIDALCAGANVVSIRQQA